MDVSISEMPAGEILGIFNTIRNLRNDQNDSKVFRTLAQCEAFDPPVRQQALQVAHEVYALAIERNIRALNAERERLRDIVHRQRKELTGLAGRLRAAQDETTADQVDLIRVLVMQKLSLDRDTEKRRLEAPQR